MATTKTVARRASIPPLHVAALLVVIVFLPLAQHAAAAGESNSNSKAMQRGHVHYYPDNNLHVFPAFPRSSAALDEAEDAETTNEPHPADELLQSQGADGTQSYILGGY